MSERTEGFPEEHEYDHQEAADFLTDVKITNVEFGVPIDTQFGNIYAQMLIHTDQGSMLIGACGYMSKQALYFFRDEPANGGEPTDDQIYNGHGREGGISYS